MNNEDLLCENYCALILSILKNYTPEESFLKLRHWGKRSWYKEVSHEDIDRVIRIKISHPELTYKQIMQLTGIIGITSEALYKRIVRKKQKLVIRMPEKLQASNGE